MFAVNYQFKAVKVSKSSGSGLLPSGKEKFTPNVDKSANAKVASGLLVSFYILSSFFFNVMYIAFPAFITGTTSTSN